MTARDQVSAVMITLDIDGIRALYIMLASDGAIMRQGTGEIGSNDKNIRTGVVDESLFEEYMETIKEETLQYPGAFKIPNQKGKPCYLDIQFQASPELIQYEFSYGSESEGPPMEIVNWVVKALELTNSWYSDQIRA